MTNSKLGRSSFCIMLYDLFLKFELSIPGMETQIEIFESSDGETQIEVKFKQDTVWLSQKQISDLFDKDNDTIGLHLKNIFSEEELGSSLNYRGFLGSSTRRQNSGQTNNKVL